MHSVESLFRVIRDEEDEATLRMEGPRRGGPGWAGVGSAGRDAAHKRGARKCPPLPLSHLAYKIFRPAIEYNGAPSVHMKPSAERTPLSR